MTPLASPWRERSLGILCATALLLAVSVTVAPPSDAEICETFGHSANCRIVFGGESSDGEGDDGDDGGGDGDGKSTRPLCHLGGPEYVGVPCDSDASGPWSNEHKCYVLPSDPQPDPSDPEHRPGGLFYDCMGYDPEDGHYTKDPFWSADPPSSPIGGNLKRDLEKAIGVGLDPMYPGMAPEPIPPQTDWDGFRMAPVGNWVWMWPREPLGGMFEPPRVEDSSTGYYVDARVKKTEWDMGDGSPLVTCAGLAEPYAPWMGDREPECGHKYEEPGNYMVKARTTWTVDYRDASGEHSIDFDLPPKSVFVRIGENQVVNK